MVRDYLASRYPAGAVSGLLPALPEQFAAQAQSWRWTQSTGDSTHIEISAEDFVRGADGRRTFLRDVTLRVFHEDTGKHDRVESAAMHMLEGGKLLSDGETVITLGVSDIEGGPEPVEVTTSEVIFDPDSNSASTHRDVRYEFADGEGSSRGAVYNASTGIVHMLADVRLVRFDAAGETRSRILAGAMVYAEQGSRIEVSRGARVEKGPLWLECDSGVVRLEDGRIRHIEGVAAEGGEEGLDSTVRFSSERVEAQFGVRGELQRMRGRGDTRYSSTDAAGSITVSGDLITMFYESSTAVGQSSLRSVEVRGDAVASMDLLREGLRNTVASELLRLAVRAGSSEIEQVETLRRGRLEQRPLEGTGPTRSLDAGWIRVNFGTGNALDSLAASGRARLVEQSGGDSATEMRTWSDYLEASFDSDTAGISELFQRGDFRFEDGDWTGSSKEARFHASSGVLELTGDASVAGNGNVVSARLILLDRATGRFDAQGDIAASVARSEAGEGEALPSGLFAGQQPVYAVADALVSDPENGNIEYRGAARLWQGKNRIDATSILIDRSAMTLTAVGDVAVAWSEDYGDGQDEPIPVTVRAEKMLYEDATGEARFREAVEFRRSGMRVLADQLRTGLGSVGGGAPASATATGTVRIADTTSGSRNRGFADRAEFRLTLSEVVLTGRPARIVGADGTVARGDRLTLGAAGDRLQISGQGADRAYSYRPPSR